MENDSRYAVQAYTNLLPEWDNWVQNAQVEYPEDAKLEWFKWPDDGAPTTVGENTGLPVKNDQRNERPPNGD